MTNVAISNESASWVQRCAASFRRSAATPPADIAVMPSGTVRIVTQPAVAPAEPRRIVSTTVEDLVAVENERVEIRCPQCRNVLLDGFSATLADMIDVAEAHRGRCPRPTAAAL